MVKDAKVERDYEITGSNTERVLSVRGRRPLRIALGLIFGLVPLWLITLFSLFAGLSGHMGAWLVFVCAGAITYFTTRWIYTVKAEKIAFTPEGLVIKNKRFRYEDISFLGFKNRNQGQIYREGSVSDAAFAAASVFNYIIYIIHGTTEVPIVVGLREDSVQPIFEEIAGLFTEFGKSFK